MFVHYTPCIPSDQPSKLKQIYYIQMILYLQILHYNEAIQSGAVKLRCFSSYLEDNVYPNITEGIPDNLMEVSWIEF